MVILGQVEMHETWETSKTISLLLRVEGITKTLLPYIIKKADWTIASWLNPKCIALRLFCTLLKFIIEKCKISLKMEEQGATQNIFPVKQT